jgi:tetratricopeptide (TPR) repeat protein
MYANGKGVPKDDGNAAEWIKKAADQRMLVASSFGLSAKLKDSIAPLLQGQIVAITAKAPINTVSDDGSVLSTITSEVGDKYDFVKLGDNSTVVLKDAGGCQYQINIGATDYKPPASVAEIPEKPSIGQKVSLTLQDGTVKMGKLVKVESDGISLLTDDGGGKILFTALSKPDQVKFGYDATTYESSGDDKSGEGDFDGAIADYTKAIEIDPKDAVAYRDRADAKAKKRDWDGAIADYSLTVALDPKDDLAFSSSGKAKAEKENWDGAIADYSKAIEIAPQSAFYYSSRGDVEGKKGDWDGAIVDYNKAVELKPDEDVFYFFRGIAKASKKDFDGAITDYTQDIKLSPNDSEAYANRGFAEAGLKDLDGAIADYTKAIELDPKDDFAYSHRADAKTLKGDVDGATADYNMATALVHAQTALVRAQTAQTASSSPSSEDQTQSDAAKGLTAGSVQINKTSQDDTYVEFGWKVPITNNTDNDATDVSVEVSCRDRNDIEIDSFTSNDNAVPSGKTVNVTKSTVMDTPKWRQADHWVVKISSFSH